MHEESMAIDESDHPPRGAAKNDDSTDTGQEMRIDASISAGTGRPSLTSPLSLKRKSSISRADIDLANVNSTVSMFMGGRRHSWMQQGTEGITSYTPRVPPPKRVRTTPSKTPGSEQRSQVEAQNPPASPTTPRPSPSQKHPTAEPIVITIPDTQPDEQTAIPQSSAMDTDPSAPIITQSSNSISISSTPTTTRSTPENTPFTASLPPQEVTSNPAPSLTLPVRSPSVPAYASPTPTPGPVAIGQQFFSGPANITTESSASPITEPKKPPGNLVRIPFGPRALGAERPVQRMRPTLQTGITTAYLQNITPPPSTSPVSATVLNGISDLGMRSAHPNAATPSPITSPQLPELVTIDVPNYLPDGSCRMHTVDLRRPTIEDHNLLLGDLQRLGQQIRESAAPNKSLIVRYSKLNHALDSIRRRINQSSVQSTHDLVSDILRRRASSTPNQSHAVPPNLPPQSPVAPSAPQSPIHHRLSIPQTERPQTTQIQHGAVPTNTMLPPPQPHHQPLPSLEHFRAPVFQVADLFAQDPTSAAPSSHTQFWPKLPLTTNFPSPQHVTPQSSVAQTAPYIGSQLQQQSSAVSNPVAGHKKVSWSYAFIDKLHSLMAQPGTEPWKPNDSLRASLLESALKQGDDLFVVVHLLFCHADHPILKNKFPFIWDDPRKKLGLELLSQLLFSNSTLSRRALNIFVQIPMDPGTAGMKVQGFNDDMMAALKLLQDIRPIFDTLYNYCDSNKLSCPSQNLIASAGIASPSLQKTINVSLSQMLTHHAKPSQQQKQRQQQQPQLTPAPRRFPPQAAAHTMRSVPHSMSPREPSSSGDAGPSQRGELQIFTTDWGGKAPGWKLVQELKHIPADLQKPEGDISAYYTYFRRCVTPVIKVSAKAQQLSFIVEGALCKSYPKVNRVEGTALNFRPVRNWSKLYRLRCVASKQDLVWLTKPDDFSIWRSHETCWPSSIVAEIYDRPNLINTSQERELVKKRRLHFRRKRNWGKDCATDLTDGLEHGENTVQVMIADNSMIDGTSYYAAVEEIEVADYNTLFQLITQTQAVSSQDAKERIITRLKKSADTIANDDEISVVEEDTVIVSMICPMSQKLIDMPVRGKDCKHLDCFDLKGYLTSRTKFPTGFSVPDSWKCPICSCECTPATLLVDGFMRDTISKLKDVQADGQYLNAKSVIIRSDGMWRPHDPPEIAHKKIKKEAPEVISLLDD